MKKQSSIEYIAEQHDKLVRWMEGDAKAEPYSFTDFNNDLNTAREMHRKEIEEAYRRGMFSEGFENEKEYYTETFQQHDNKG